MTPLKENKEVRGPSIFERRLRLAARLSAWLLLAAIAVSIVSGWGISRTEVIYTASVGLIDRGLANTVHRSIQVPMAAMFLTHILLNARLALGPRPERLTLPISISLTLIGIALFVLVIYMEFLV